MKYIFLSFCLFAFLNIKAQTDTVRKDIADSSLTESELQTAKEKYVQMMKTETYILYKKSTMKIAKKFKKLMLPDPREVDFNDKEQIRKWLNPNISITDLHSVDEGVEMIYSSHQLIQKLYAENTEVYTLMRKSNRAQLKEILEPEHSAAREKIYSGNVD